MNPFDSVYADLYNKIHSAKNYDDEALKLFNFCNERELIKPNSRILDFGCGTGSHIKSLKKLGLSVDGYDPSSFMIENTHTEFKDVNFFSDLDDMKIKYDLIYSLFDVFSYQVEDVEVTAFLTQILTVLKDSAFFIFDYWNADGVKKNPPTERVLHFDNLGVAYTRMVTLGTSELPNISNLIIEIYRDSNDELVYRKNHFMRAFSEIDILKFLPSTCELIALVDQADYKSKISSNSWRALALIRKL